MRGSLAESDVNRGPNPLLWAALWPIRTWIRRSPIARGRHFLIHRVVKPLLPHSTFQAALPCGGKLALNYRETIGLSMLLEGHFEPAEVRAAVMYAKPGTMAIDCGANVGIFTVPLAFAVGSEGIVLAVEPFPENVSRLLENLALNRISWVNVSPVAAGSSSGTAALRLADDPAYPSTSAVSQGRGVGESITVDRRTLDELWKAGGRRPVSFLKIDVEGDELAVLIGAEELIYTCKPVLMIEALDGQHFDSIYAWLWKRGYAIKYIHGSQPWNRLFTSSQEARTPLA